MPKHILANGHQTLLPQNSSDQPYLFSNWDFLNYQLTVDAPVRLTGFNILSNSDLTVVGHGLANNGTTVVANDSQLAIQGNLSGTGDIIGLDSSISIGGPSDAALSSPSVTSETIGLVDHAQLYLGNPPGMTFLAPIYMDSTSTIHFENNPVSWSNDLISNDYHQMLSATHPPADLIGGMAYVKSLTPGYQPTIGFQFAPGPGSVVIGVTITDTLIAHS